MNMNKLKNFTKKYGFYLAVGVISLGAITAVFFTSRDEQVPGGEFEVYSENPNEAQAGDKVLDSNKEDDTVLLEDEDVLAETEEVSDEVVEGEKVEMTTPEEEQAVEEPHTTQEVIATEEDEIVSETFNSTTVEEVDTPFFAEGDTMAWPVQGDVIVPYTDDTTKHWLSTALNQTMRTYGVCIAAEEGTQIKAPATATVVDIVEDATTIDWYKRIGDVGKIIILDHGNGYQTQIGVQDGEVNKDLLGQTIKQGTTIATVGQATGPFVDLGSNVYMQVRHNEEIVNPTVLLEQNTDVAQGVDMGHSEE